MTAFALPPVALPGDRLPDTWLDFGGGERLKLHKGFGGRPMWLAAGGDASALPQPPAGTDAIYIGAPATPLPPGWRPATADPAWSALIGQGLLRLDANFRVTADATGEPGSDDDHGRAPVLQVPRVLEPELCRALIEHFERACAGGEPSHVLVIENGRQTLQLAPDIKARRESPIRDPQLEAAVHARLHRRVIPEIARVFQFGVSRRDPFKLLSYEAGAGYFRAHRDNDTPDVAYRRFAMSINLDTAAYRGGAFRFPEFGPHAFAPRTGEALVFSCSLLHEVLPIEQGTRRAITTFLA